MLNPDILENNMNTVVLESELVTSSDENNESNGVTSSDEINETNGVASNDETNKSNEVTREDEDDGCENINIVDEDGRKKETDERDIRISTIQQGEDINRSKKEITSEVTVRRSERVRKQRYNIHPDDIGNNDDKDDENYKMKKMKRK